MYIKVRLKAQRRRKEELLRVNKMLIFVLEINEILIRACMHLHHL